MMFSRSFVPMVIALASLVTFSTDSNAAHPLSLRDAVSMALTESEGVLIGRESTIAARASVRGAQGAYDPVLGMSGGWWRSTNPLTTLFLDDTNRPYSSEDEWAGMEFTVGQLLPTGGELVLRGRGSRQTTTGSFTSLSPAYETSGGVEFRQPLLRGRAVDPVRFTIRRARAARAAEDASFERVVTETIAAVEVAYWELVATRMEVDVREEAVRLAEEQLNETTIRIDRGVSPRTELSQPRAELERRRGELYSALESAKRAENALKLLIMSERDESLWGEDLSPTDSVGIETQTVDVVAALKQALHARPEIAVAEAAVEKQRAETAFARDGVWPDLDAVVSYDRLGIAGSRNPSGPGGELPPDWNGAFGESIESLGDGDYNAVRVSVVLSLPLRNRTAKSNAVVARSAERQAEANLTSVRKIIRSEVLDAAASLETAAQRVEAARSARESAEIQLSAERDLYANGLSTNFLVLTRQNDLSHALLDEIAAQTDYRTAETEMARATGTLAMLRGVDMESMNGEGDKK